MSRSRDRMDKPFNILILEDSPADAELVVFELENAGLSFSAKVVKTEKEFVAAIGTFCPDIILSDYDIPRYTGAQALAEANRNCPDTPFILVTGAVGEDRAIEILTQGAKDYVLKSRLEQRLAPAVKRALAEAFDHRARRKAEEELRDAHRNLERQVAERTAELQRQNERLEILSYTAGRLLETDHPQQLMEDLCRRIMAFLDCQMFFNFLVDDASGRLHLNAYAGIPKETAAEIEWLDFGVAVCGCVARDGSRIVAENIFETPDVRTELVKSFGIKAYACHPLLEASRTIGTLSFGTCSRTTFSAADLAMMKAVADQVAIAMNRIRQASALRAAHAKLETTVQERTSELIKTVAHLEDERRRFIDVLDILPAYVILLSPDYHVPFENRFFRERFGEAKGRRCYEFLFNRTEPCEVCETYKTLQTMNPLEWEWTGPDERNYYIYDFPFKDTDGSTLILEMGLDVTDYKKSQMELEIYRHHLEELVELRTAQLAATNREMESFSYSVSHDLRAPLRAIDGFSKIIQRDHGTALDEKALQLFGKVRDSVKMMGQLIDDLLNFSRLGQKAPDIKPININELAETVWQELQQAYPERNVSLSIQALPPLSGDKSLMKQVFANLLSNAIKFTKIRPIARIEIGGNEDERECTYYVRDNGVGFDMEYHDKMFGVFQRLHSPADYDGSGVGLALAQRIIHKHGGRIWAEGEEDKGACFFIALPKEHPPDAPAKGA
ncbi:MAG: response regulator [Deltaproteobacteria bacterium]|nr:response regulator [Deltaproteobacteria bacterium]